MKYIAIEADPEVARSYETIGIDCMMVDLERYGKAERQARWNTHLSNHTAQAVPNLSRTLRNSELIVRVNPVVANMPEEINLAIEGGAHTVMLPMFHTRREVEIFLDRVAGRARTILLFETPQAICRIDDILNSGRIDEAYIGLNDLSLALGLDFVFEPLAGGIVDFAASKFRDRGIPFGFGGLGPMDQGDIPGARILAEHQRLGSTSVILSRAFFASAGNSPGDLSMAFRKVSAEQHRLESVPPEELERLSSSTREMIHATAKRRAGEQA